MTKVNGANIAWGIIFLVLFVGMLTLSYANTEELVAISVLVFLFGWGIVYNFKKAFNSEQKKTKPIKYYWNWKFWVVVLILFMIVVESIRVIVRNIQ